MRVWRLQIIQNWRNRRKLTGKRMNLKCKCERLSRRIWQNRKRKCLHQKSFLGAETRPPVMVGEWPGCEGALGIIQWLPRHLPECVCRPKLACVYPLPFLVYGHLALSRKKSRAVQYGMTVVKFKTVAWSEKQKKHKKPRCEVVATRGWAF